MNADLHYFNRYEFKYWVDPYVRDRLIEYLLNFMSFDKNNIDGKPYDICSLYLDTKNLSCYYEKYDGDVFRRKYRIRFYNGNVSRLSFEIKEKHNLYIKKKREIAQIDQENPTEIPISLLNGEANLKGPFVHAYLSLNLEPTTWVAYQRVALVGRNNPGLRVTFDDGLSGCKPNGFEFRTKNLQPVTLSRWHQKTILEIKFNNYLPFWLEQCLKDLNLSHQSISKYGMNINRFFFYHHREGQWTL